MAPLRDRAVIVTGAGSGIGRATALHLGSEGAAVTCVDLVGEAARQTARSVGEAGGRCVAVECDVSDAEAVRRCVDEAASSLGRPTGLCNAAGIGKFAHTVDEPVDEFDRILAVNLRGTFLMCQAVLPHMLEPPSAGAIVNISSTAGLIGQPYSAAYCASKGGVSLLTKALALEFIERSVRVNAVAPGGIETPLMGDFGFPEGSSRKLFDKIMSPMGFGQPEEVASLVAFLLSDESRYMTGSIVPIDGGVTI